MRIWLSIFLLGFGLLVYGWKVGERPSIVVENRSDATIESVEFVVVGLGDVRATLDASTLGGQTLPSGSEGEASIEVRFEDGTLRRYPAGWYSSAGRHDLHVTIVSPDSIAVDLVDAGARALR